MTEEHLATTAGGVPLCYHAIIKRRTETFVMGNWSIAEGCKYTRSDEWLRLEGSEALIGISDYAQNALSDLVFIELPKLGTSFSAGEAFGVVESVKAAADVNMPVSGEIVGVNDELEGAPETVNQDAYGKGWLIRIRILDDTQLGILMDATQYAAYCNERG